MSQHVTISPEEAASATRPRTSSDRARSSLWRPDGPRGKLTVWHTT